jgi:hypothetical protein
MASRSKRQSSVIAETVRKSEGRRTDANGNQAPALDFDSFVRAALATGKPPKAKPKKKAAKRRPRKGGK